MRKPTGKGISLLTARAYDPRVSFEAPLTRPRPPRKLLRAVVARLLGRQVTEKDTAASADEGGPSRSKKRPAA